MIHVLRHVNLNISTLKTACIQGNKILEVY